MNTWKFAVGHSIDIKINHRFRRFLGNFDRIIACAGNNKKGQGKKQGINFQHIMLLVTITLSYKKYVLNIISIELFFKYL